MEISHKKFNVIIWKHNKNVFNPYINTEVKSFTITPSESIDAQPMLATSKNPLSNAVLIGIEWTYMITNNKKTILTYNVEDEALTNTALLNKEAAINEFIKESYKRVTDYFDSKKIELGLLEHIMPELDEPIKAGLVSYLLKSFPNKP